MRFRFRKDQRILVKGREYVILEKLPNGDLKLQDIVSEATIAYPSEQLTQELFRGTVSIVDANKVHVRECLKSNLAVDFNALPEKEREKARRRFEYIREILAQKMDRKVLKAYEPIIKIVAERIQDDKPPSPSSVYRWHSDYEASGENIRSLVSAVNKGNATIKVDDLVDEIITDVIAELFMDKQRLKPAAIRSAVIKRIDEKNKIRVENNKARLPIPAISTIYNRIKKLDPYEVAKSRFGKRYADARFGILKSNTHPTRPLERVEMDHTKTDLLVVDEIRGLLIGRPWVTAALDVYSKSLLGFYLGFTPPSYVTVMHCLKHAIKTKEYIQKDYPDLKNTWDTFGLPETIVVDNGKEFHSTHLEDACLQLQIVLQYAPPKVPWYKGSIERFFGTLNTDLLHEQPGTTFSNYLEKGEYDSSKNAIIDLSLLKWLFHKWIVDVYHQSEHRGVHDQPAFLWNEGIKAYPPALPQSENELRILLGKVIYKPITAAGITILGIIYKDSALAIFRRRHGSNKVRIKYDPMDLSLIYVYDEIDRVYIPIPAENQEYTNGLNEWQHQMIWRHARKTVGKRIDIVALAYAKEAMRLAVVEYMAKRKGDRTCVKAARFTETEPYKITTKPEPPFSSGDEIDNENNRDLVQTEGSGEAMAGASEIGTEKHQATEANHATEVQRTLKTGGKKKRKHDEIIQEHKEIEESNANLNIDDEEWQSNYDLEEADAHAGVHV